MLSSPNPLTVVGVGLGWSFPVSARTVVAGFPEGTLGFPSFRAFCRTFPSSRDPATPEFTLAFPSFRVICRTFPSSRDPVTPDFSVRDSVCEVLGPWVGTWTPSGRGATGVGPGTVVPWLGALDASGRPGVATGVAARSFFNRALVRLRAA